MLRTAVFALATVALLLLAGLLLLGPVYPTQDGPSHLYNAWLLLEHDPFNGWLERSSATLPQWLAPLLLAVQLKIGSAEWALRWHQVIVALASPLVLWWVAKDRYSGALAAMAGVALSVGYPFTMGFFSFCLGQALMLAAVGLFSRWHDQVTIPRMVAFTALATVLYYAHIVPFGLAVGLSIGLLILQRGRGWRLLLGFAPGLLLLAAYLAGPRHAPYVLPSVLSTPYLDAVGHLFLMPISSEPAFAEARWLTLAILGIALVAALVARTEDRRWRDGDGLAAMAALLVAISPLVPDGGGGGSLLQARLADSGTWLVLLWVSQQRVLARAGLVASVTVLLMLMPVLGTRYWYASWLYATIGDIRSASSLIPSGRTILAISLWPTDYDVFDHDRSYWTRPLDHTEGWIGVESKAFNLYNYEAASGLFPLRFRETQSPDTALFHNHPPPVPVAFDLDGYLSRANAPLDYVLLINPDGPRRTAVESVFAQVDRCCEFVARTPGGMVAIYRRRR